ncbi:MAG: hypothetical protein ACJARD_000951 [Alphaproteobacteria bacterium]|jgi:hypothetical protein
MSDINQKKPSGLGINGLVNEFRKQSTKFSNHDFLTDFKNEAEKCDTKTLIDPKNSPTLKQLNSIKDELAVMNAHIGITSKIGTEYQKLIKNEKNIDKVYTNLVNQNTHKKSQSQSQDARLSGTAAMPKPQDTIYNQNNNHHNYSKSDNGTTYQIVPFDLDARS